MLTGRDINIGDTVTSNTMLLSDKGDPTDFLTVISTFTEVTTATTTVANVSNSLFIREKNALEQNPLVRLYTIYYPGEWYPPNNNGNPTDKGAGYPWPYKFPIKIAEVRGDYISDIDYRVSMDGKEYMPYPVNSGIIDTDSSGRIGEVSITLSNFDNMISDIIENPYLVGYAEGSMVTSAVVNGELVGNIDSRTVPGHTNFDQNIANTRGGTNVAMDYVSATQLGNTWVNQKQDSRDLLGAIVEIKSTFANFLDVWPEYSVATDRADQERFVPVRSTLPYRIGDLVANSTLQSAATFTINSISATGLYFDQPSYGLDDTFYSGSPVYIVNPDRDEESYVLDRFRIDSMNYSDDKTSNFTLTNWLQYFKLQLPRRKFYKNTCTWIYKGPECGYPSSGQGPIPNTSFVYIDVKGDNVQSVPVTANGFFNLRNESVLLASQDVCAKNLEACRLRNNQLHFGGFPATGRNLPR